MEIEIQGLEKTIALLDELPKDVVARGYLKALQAGASVIYSAVGERVPEKSEDTGGILAKGELRNNIATEVQLDTNFRGGVATVGFTKKVANVPLWVEYGHAIVDRTNGKVVGQVPEHPFMRPAFDASAEASIDAFTESLKETVQNEYAQSTEAA